MTEMTVSFKIRHNEHRNFGTIAVYKQTTSVSMKKKYEHRSQRNQAATTYKLLILTKFLIFSKPIYLLVKY